MKNVLAEVRNLKKNKKSSSSADQILMKFQEYALATLRQAPVTHKIVLIFTNDGKGTPTEVQMMIRQWLDRQPWAYRIKAVYLE